jgi:hypothetical protein
MKKLIATMILALCGTAMADGPTFSGELGNVHVWAGVTSIDLNAYKDTGTVEASPATINVGASFWQDGDTFGVMPTVTLKFLFAFDPDNLMLAPLLQSFAPVQLTGLVNGQNDPTAKATLTLPDSMKKFATWCTDAGNNYTYGGILTTVLTGATVNDLIYAWTGSTSSFTNVSLNVHCLATKPLHFAVNLPPSVKIALKNIKPLAIHPPVH